MNIINSKYNKEIIENLINKQIQKIGEKNYKLILSLETIIKVFKYLLIFIISTCFILHTIKIQDSLILYFFISVIMYVLIISMILNIFDYTDDGIFKITKKIMKLKNIPFNPILNKNFRLIYKEHQKLLEVSKLVNNLRKNNQIFKAFVTSYHPYRSGCLSVLYYKK